MILRGNMQTLMFGVDYSWQHPKTLIFLVDYPWQHADIYFPRWLSMATHRRWFSTLTLHGNTQTLIFHVDSPWQHTLIFHVDYPWQHTDIDFSRRLSLATGRRALFTLTVRGNRYDDSGVWTRGHLPEPERVVPVQLHEGLHGAALREEHQRVRLGPLSERRHLPGRARGLPLHLHAR